MESTPQEHNHHHNNHHHLVAIPFPGRGHINPMINLCNSLLSRTNSLQITLILTEEWLSLISSYPYHPSLCFSTIPNILPSEHTRASDHPSFLHAVRTIMESPVDLLLDSLLPTTIISDTLLSWTVKISNRRLIPVLSLWTMSTSMFWLLYHLQKEESHLQVPGISAITPSDLPSIFFEKTSENHKYVVESMASVKKCKALVLNSVYEMEAEVIEAVKGSLGGVGVYTVGALIRGEESLGFEGGKVWEWLEKQPLGSVLYVSQGSFLSVKEEQGEETREGLRMSGVRYLWVRRGKGVVENWGERGVEVEWCDQANVMKHSAVGGFWSHCGWNSTMEAACAGVAVLGFPITIDQPVNVRVLEEWGMGRRVGRAGEVVVGREEIADIVRGFMGDGGDFGTMRAKAAVVREKCLRAVDVGGSSYVELGILAGVLVKDDDI